jgi:hypothetical protein
MWWFQDSTKPSRYTAGLFYAFFVLELCSDKKGHKKTSIKLRFCGILAEKEGLTASVFAALRLEPRVLIPLSKKKQA